MFHSPGSISWMAISFTVADLDISFSKISPAAAETENNGMSDETE